MDATDYSEMFREHAQNDVGHLRIEQVGCTNARMSLPVRRIFVPIKVDVRHADGARLRGIDFATVFANHRAFVVLGDAGSGKSSLLRWLAAVIAARDHDALQIKEEEPSNSLLPLFVGVRRLAELRRLLGDTASVSDVLSRHFHEALGRDEKDIRTFLEEQLEAHSCLVLLDGLDAVPKEERIPIGAWVASFASRHSGNRFLATSRLVGYDDFVLPEGVVVTMRRFEDEQVRRYFELFPLATGPPETRASVADDAAAVKMEQQRLLDAYETSPWIADLATNPLMLSRLTLMQHSDGQAPRNRLEMCKRFARELSEIWTDGLAKDDDQDGLIRLGELAFRMHKTWPGGVAPQSFVVDTLVRSLDPSRQDQTAATDVVERFLGRVRDAKTVLQERGPAEWGFIHPAFEEFFAAAGLLARDEFERVAIDHVFDPHWEGVIRIGVGCMALEKTPEAVGRLLERIFRSRASGQRAWLSEHVRKQVVLAALLADEFDALISAALQREIAEAFVEWLLDVPSEVSFPLVRALRPGEFAERVFDFLVAAGFDPLQRPWDATRGIPPSSKGYMTRALAIQALALLKSPRVPDALLNALSDRDVVVREAAAEGLSAVKSERAVDALLAALSDKAGSGDEHLGVRIGAARALGAIDSERAVDALLAVCTDRPRAKGHGQMHLRKHATAALRSMNRERVIDALLRNLNHSQAAQRRLAVELLGTFGNERAVVPLVGALRDADAYVRSTAIEVIGAFKSGRVVDRMMAFLPALNDGERAHRARAADALDALKTESLLQPLLDALAEKQTRLNAAEALGALGDDRGVAAMVEDLTALHGDGRSAAAHALASLNSVRATDALLEALRHPAPEVRAAAAGALGAIQSERTTDPLLEALRDRNHEVRSRAASALGGVNTPRVVEALVKSLKDPHYEVRSGAARALGAIKSARAVNALLDARHDPHPDVRHAAAEGLWSEHGAGALYAALTDSDYLIRTRAAEAVFALKGEAGVDALLNALNDPDRSVQRWALDSVGTLAGERAVEGLLAVMKHNDYFRLSAAKALGTLKSERAVDGLTSALRDKDLDVRSSAVEALGKIRSDRAVHALVEGLNQRPHLLRAEVLGALWNIANPMRSERSL